MIWINRLVTLKMRRFSKAKELLNWRPKVKLEQGVSSLIDWLKDKPN